MIVLFLYAKSSLSKEQLDVKMDIGCDGVEIQLLSELVNGKLGGYLKADSVLDLDSFKDYPIKVIHCPLLYHYGLSDVNIESFARRDFDLLDQVCYIANYFGRVQSGNKILVVIHSEMNLENMRVNGLLKDILKSVSYVLFKYPFIELAIENVTPLRKVYQSEICLCNNFSFDNVELVGYLREELGTNRIGTCLDTCHAMISRKYMEAIHKEIGDIECPDYSLESYFDKNKEYVKLIHLSDAQDSGYGIGRHGVKFNDKNINKLRGIIDLYNRYGYSCPVTLEVNETDYSICNCYKETRDALAKVLSEY